MTSPFTSRSPSVQGTALIFHPKHDWVNGGVLLRPQTITSRNIKPKEVSHYFIENTNIDNIPRNGIGTLVAFSKLDTRPRDMKMWSLGVLIYLHNHKTIISPCTMIRFGCKDLTADRYNFSNSTIVFDSPLDNQNFQLIYLNALSGNNTCGDDGYIQSDVDGPDVLFQYDNMPSEIMKNQYTEAHKNNNQLYDISKPTQNPASNKKVCTDLRSTSLIPLCLNTDPVTRLVVLQKKLDKNPGFAFPYPCGLDDMKPKLVKFAFLTYKDSMNIISNKKMTIDNYVLELNKVAMYHDYLSVEYVDKSTLVIEESNYVKSHNGHHHHLHALWKKCDTISVNDWSSLKNLIRRTYKNCSFCRSKSKHFGLNVYMGKKNSSCVRPTPKMCQTSTIDSEYYRKQWDPTFHSLLYHMLQDLSYQANNFQKSVDPIYQTFLK